MSIDKSLKAHTRADEKELLEAVFASLRMKGEVLEFQHQGPWDYIFQRSGGSIQTIEFKKMVPIRYRSMLEAISYSHILATRKVQAGNGAWIVFLVESMPDGALERIGRFVVDYEIEVNVVVIDVYHQITLITQKGVQRSGALKDRVSMIGNLRASREAKSKQKKPLSFSPNQQWILKYLLLNGIDERYWGFEENRKLLISSELSQASGVVQSHCYETLKALESSKYLIPESGTYRFRNLGELLDNWRKQLEHQKLVEYYAMPISPALASRNWWKDLGKQSLEAARNLSFRFAVGGAAASAYYGLKNSADGSVILHLGSVEQRSLESLLRSCKLVVSEDPTTIQIVLHKSEKPVVEVCNVRPIEEPFVDILQASFDSWRFGSRGREQSELILEKVLYPFWQKKGWSL